MSINTVLIDHLSYVTIYHCSLGRSHKAGFTNIMGSLKTSGSRKEQNIVLTRKSRSTLQHGTKKASFQQFSSISSFTSSLFCCCLLPFTLYNWNIVESGVKHHKPNQANRSLYIRIRYHEVVIWIADK